MGWGKGHKSKSYAIVCFKTTQDHKPLGFCWIHWGFTSLQKPKINLLYFAVVTEQWQEVTKVSRLGWEIQNTKTVWSLPQTSAELQLCTHCQLWAMPWRNQACMDEKRKGKGGKMGKELRGSAGDVGNCSPKACPWWLYCLLSWPHLLFTRQQAPADNHVFHFVFHG